MDKFDIETDTGKIKNPFDFSELPCDKKILKSLNFVKRKMRKCKILKEVENI